jgi:hypothetical protein
MTVALSGCDFFGLFGSSNSNNATPTAVATTDGGTNTSGLSTYDGGTYTIGYQADWKIEKKENGIVIFTSPLGPIKLGIAKIPNPGEIAPADASSASTLGATIIGVKNAQQQGSPTTTTVGGVSWNQITQVGTVEMDNGQTVQAKITYLVTNYPAKNQSTNLYTIAYAGTTDTYDILKSTYFQSMLDSFKFTV